MSNTIEITSSAQFEDILKSSRVVVSDCELRLLDPLVLLHLFCCGLVLTLKVYAKWCAPCKQIAPIYEELSVHLSIPNQITFTKVNVDKQGDLASNYIITAYAAPSHTPFTMKYSNIIQ